MFIINIQLIKLKHEQKIKVKTFLFLNKQVCAEVYVSSILIIFMMIMWQNNHHNNHNTHNDIAKIIINIKIYNKLYANRKNNNKKKLYDFFFVFCISN